jgi:putative heme-binding domain-containing protein
MQNKKLLLAIAALVLGIALVWGWLALAPRTRSRLEAGKATDPASKKADVSEDPFKAHVRPTPPRSPAEEQSGFHLPPGFQIELFASEPDIGKAMNLAFDSRGRLWMTVSQEYPHAAPDGKGKDRVLILEDTNHDGRADRFIPFAEGLNIPMGVTPVPGGAIVYSIPYIYRFFDLNGDDRADQKVVLFSRFTHDDTHGMVSAFTRGFDGWLYACHGFSNKSRISAPDGSTVTLDSGNTFRFRLDGSRIEHFTYGQVNPFGLAFDPLGNIYSTDCHTQPVYQLLRGGDYPHFAKLPTGLGFGPEMMDHNHGSTAIAGIVNYSADQFPAEYRGNIFTGNVVTSRINRDALEARGSTQFAVEKPDFLVSDDPWFRPVDMELGPDGALYVSDFYNRIIGHIEVPLDHPGRDRTRGRIWRIYYQGRDTAPARAPRTSWADAALEDLLVDLGHANLAVRMLAANEIVDRVGLRAIDPVRNLLQSASAKPVQKCHALWILYRLKALDFKLLEAAARDTDASVRIHAMRALTEQPEFGPSERSLALEGIRDPDALVQRAATEALRLHPQESQMQPLLELRARIPSKDTHLLYTARMALRDQLRVPEILDVVARKTWDKSDTDFLADAALGVESERAGQFLLEYLETPSTGSISVGRYVAHAARFAPEKMLDRLIRAARSLHPQTQEQAGLYKVFQQGISERGLSLPGAARSWGLQLTQSLLATKEEQNWRNAFEIAGSLRWEAVEPRLVGALKARDLKPDTRAAAAEALLAINPEKNVPLVGEMLQDSSEKVELQGRIIAAFRRIDSPAVTAQLVRALSAAPARLQTRLAANLVQREDSARAMLDAIESGKASRQVLLRSGIQIRLKSLPTDIRARADRLTRNLSQEEASLEGLLDQRRAAFHADQTVAARGAGVFEKYCIKCHQLGGKGKTVGPQLDGAGSRGLERLIEDVLDPNRNVENAFRSQMIKLKDGGTVTGVVVKEQGSVLVVVDELGQELQVPRQQIEARRESQLSPMPSDFAEQIPPDDFNHLLAFLLSAGKNRTH